MEEKIKETEQEIIDESKTDDNGLWFIVGGVRNKFPDKSKEEIKNITLQILKNLLEQKKIIPAVFTKGSESTREDLINDYRSWKLNPEETIKYIDQEWTKLGRDPNIGEIIHFTTPEGIIDQK